MKVKEQKKLFQQAREIAIANEKEIVSGACTQTRRKCPLIFPSP